MKNLLNEMKEKRTEKKAAKEKKAAFKTVQKNQAKWIREQLKAEQKRKQA